MTILMRLRIRQANRWLKNANNRAAKAVKEYRKQTTRAVACSMLISKLLEEARARDVCR